MAKYIIKRIIMMIPIILGSAIMVFTIMYFCPGDPASMILGATAVPEAIEELRDKMGLNDPYIVRLGRILLDLVKGDFGNDITSGLPISQQLALRLPNTLKISLVGIVIGLFIGIPIGVTSAVHHDKPLDYIGMLLALIGISVPGFWFAMVMVSFFAVKLRWLPPFGVGGFKYWILPVLSSCLGGFAGNARQSRSCMLDVLSSDYVVMARAKGLPEKEVIWKHAFPNAMLPLVMGIGGALALSVGGGMIIETVFGIPGVGFYMTEAISNRDYGVIQACVIMIGIVFSVMMLLTDIAMAFIDPRIKEQFQSGKKRKRKGEAA